MGIRNVFLSAVAVAALTTGVSAQTVSMDTVLATVGDTDITVANLIDVKRQLPQQYQTLPDDVLLRGVLDQLIQQTLLTQTLTSTPAWIETAIANERRNLLSGVVIDQIRATAVTEEAVQAAYTARFADAGGDPEFNASHILVETEEKAKELITQLEGGADFATLAAEHSTGPSGPNGGQLGWFGEGQMVPEFELAVKQLDKDEVSPPVATQFGWHIVKLNDARAKAAPSLESVRGELELELQNAAVEARIAELLADTQVTRNEDGIDILDGARKVGGEGEAA
ncbi:MAG: peptidylprolyl isomerase, partial [Planktomarina sp.]